jgi:hypothetical protein
MKDVLRELNWVKERAACSLGQVFSELHQGIQEDVREINLARQISAETAFEIVQSGNGDAFIVKRRESIRPFVKFSKGRDLIEVSDDTATPKSEFRITFSNEGRCKLMINGEEFEQWQVRRSTLEKLFFTL